MACPMKSADTSKMPLGPTKVCAHFASLLCSNTPLAELVQFLACFIAESASQLQSLAQLLGS
eukprot:3377477-Amphidinium_carterae.1